MKHKPPQTSGRSNLTPADDPFASGRALEISQSDSANTQFTSNRNAAKHATTVAEAILNSVTSLLQDVRTSAVANGSGVLTKSDKMSLATELSGRLEELEGLANSTDGIGNYLFSGYQGRTLPFVRDQGGILYVADDGQRMIQVDSSRRLATSDSGGDIFMRIKNGNGKFVVDASTLNVGSGVFSQGVVSNPAALTGDEYLLKFCIEDVDGAPQTRYDVINVSANQTLSKDNIYSPGQVINFDGMQFDIKGEPGDLDEFYVHPSENESIFKTLADLVSALKLDRSQDASAAKAQYTNSINRALNNIDRGLENVSTVRTSLGSRLRELDALQVSGDDVGLQYKRKLSELQDVDLNKAISDLNQQQTSLTAAQKSFKQASDLTLFNYL